MTTKTRTLLTVPNRGIIRQLLLIISYPH